MKNTKELPAGITQEMVDAAKVAYPKEGHVKMASLPLDDDGNDFLDVLVRKPDRRVIGEFTKWMEKNPTKADEILVNSCLLSHKDQVKADDALFGACVDAISQLISMRKAIIKNL